MRLTISGPARVRCHEADLLTPLLGEPLWVWVCPRLLASDKHDGAREGIDVRCFRYLLKSHLVQSQADTSINSETGHWVCRLPAKAKHSCASCKFCRDVQLPGRSYTMGLLLSRWVRAPYIPRK